LSRRSFVQSLLEWAKVDLEVYRSGPLKDAGNPMRGSTEAERAYLQALVDTLAQQFYGDVRKARPKMEEGDFSASKMPASSWGMRPNALG